MVRIQTGEKWFSLDLSLLTKERALIPFSFVYPPPRISSHCHSPRGVSYWLGEGERGWGADAARLRSRLQQHINQPSGSKFRRHHSDGKTSGKPSSPLCPSPSPLPPLCSSLSLTETPNGDYKVNKAPPSLKFRPGNCAFPSPSPSRGQGGRGGPFSVLSSR